jgi:glucose-6-phosphate 1-dehydrogenase
MTSASSRRNGIWGSVPHPDNHVIVLFGATGDLARRKLLPGLFHLFVAGLLLDRYRIVGSARRSITGEQFREHARQSVAEFGASKPVGDAWSAFGRALSFASAEPVGCQKSAWSVSCSDAPGAAAGHDDRLCPFVCCI